MSSGVGGTGRRLIRAIAEQLGIESVKYGPAALDVDDVKVVAPLPIIHPYQEFFTSVNAINAGGVNGFELEIFRVGGVAENGQGVAQQINSTDNATGAANDPAGSAATDWDYKILAMAVQVQLSAAQALAEDGNFCNVEFSQLSELITIDQAGDDPSFTGFRVPFYKQNLFDDQEIDTDERVYTWALSSGGNGSAYSLNAWPGWIPGIVGAGLRCNIYKRTLSGGVRAAWLTAVQFRSRVYGLRFRKGTFPLAR